MFKPKRLTYANVAATLALVFSMSGGALAASKYLITSTKQISPKVIKKLKGKRGPAGPAGKAGPAGPAGSTGLTGKEGAPGKNLTAETTLPSGQSESGAFSAASGYDAGNAGKEFGWIGAGITYVQPLATAIPANHIVDVRSGTALHCAGPGHADPGYLCLYDSIVFDVEEGYGYSTNEELGLPTGAQSPGVVLYWPVEGPGEPYAGGVYTVTAP